MLFCLDAFVLFLGWTMIVINEVFIRSVSKYLVSLQSWEFVSISYSNFVTELLFVRRMNLSNASSSASVANTLFGIFCYFEHNMGYAVVYHQLLMVFFGWSLRTRMLLSRTRWGPCLEPSPFSYFILIKFAFQEKYEKGADQVQCMEESVGITAPVYHDFRRWMNKWIMNQVQ